MGIGLVVGTLLTVLMIWGLGFWPTAILSATVALAVYLAAR